MADAPTSQDTPKAQHPVRDGLIALVGVAVVVGLLAAVALAIGTGGFGGSGGSDDATAVAAADEPTSGETLYLPEPSKTQAPEGPRITLDVNPDEVAGIDEEEVEKKPKKKQDLILIAGQESVAPMQRIDLSGSFAGPTGAILQVQRKENGVWSDFPVTVSVNGGAFGTYVVTGREGAQQFRVVDTDSGKASKPVTVQVG